jgi:hypothetical protein
VGRLESNAQTAGNIEQPNAVADQYWGKLNDDLEKQPTLDALLCEVGAEDGDILPPAAPSHGRPQPRCPR